ncbi:HI1506-related protein [Aeromonas hydrophila]|uniref:HI1506-related protein n=1 Tax=Aeromonas hydrophila TaxID=644 RepID=UPI0023AF271B|nr:HI1506-related protein [Aeromonas hydrophila]MDE8809492.1 HI1506-related protein [Aeromonas hydrophila]
MAIRVRVISKLHQGYHRAGQAIAPGESELVVSDLQCAALEGDPRLVVVRLAEDVAHPESAPDVPQTAGDLDDAALGELSQAPESLVPEAVEPAAKPDSGKGKGK